MDMVRHLHMAFEWSRNALAWSSPPLKELLRLMPLRCEFDGCQYGLRAQDGAWLRKPWCVRTNAFCLQQPFSRRCPGDHPHRTLR
eukprot:240256-Heterocapsa_arctica.AAC.1